jgi:hypothetical protein
VRVVFLNRQVKLGQVFADFFGFPLLLSLQHIKLNRSLQTSDWTKVSREKYISSVGNHNNVLWWTQWTTLQSNYRRLRRRNICDIFTRVDHPTPYILCALLTASPFSPSPLPSKFIPVTYLHISLCVFNRLLIDYINSDTSGRILFLFESKSNS